MISFSTIQDVLYGFVTSESGRDAIWRNQNAPNKKEGHFALLLNNFSHINREHKTTSADENGNIILSYDSQFELQIDYFGTGAMQFARDLRIASEKEVSLQTFIDSGFVYIDSNTISDISFLRDQNFSERSRFNMTFRTTENILDNVGYFDRTQIAGNIINFDKNYTVYINSGGA